MLSRQKMAKSWRLSFLRTLARVASDITVYHAQTIFTASYKNFPLNLGLVKCQQENYILQCLDPALFQTWKNLNFYHQQYLNDKDLAQKYFVVSFNFQKLSDHLYQNLNKTLSEH